MTEGCEADDSRAAGRPGKKKAGLTKNPAEK
jgi:hypothetical protein